MKISEIITDKYKLRIPPNVYYDLLADVREAEEEQEPICPSAGVDCEDCPAYEPKTGWIPVSKRLPEEYCLFCDIDGDVFYGHIYDGRWWAEGQDDRIKNVIAWMPLPEPYKAEGGKE